MCAIYGFLNYGNKIPHKTLLKIMRELSIAAECRGTDATGISYVKDGKMVTFKTAEAAHNVQLFFPKDTTAVIGHNRMTTQGSEKKNYNNHPFEGTTADHAFALAHNGILYNDIELKALYKLPETKIETDSYAAVQFLERYDTLDSDTLKETAEALFGSFVLTVLRDDNTLFLVKGDNPITLYHFPKYGLYIYASTDSILRTALKSAKVSAKHTSIPVKTEDIIRIDADGTFSANRFELSEPEIPKSMWVKLYRDDEISKYDIYDICGYYGVDEDEVDLLFSLGYTISEIEEMLMDTDFLEAALAEAKAYHEVF